MQGFKVHLVVMKSNLHESPRATCKKELLNSRKLIMKNDHNTTTKIEFRYWKLNITKYYFNF